VDHVPDPLLLRKSGSAGNRIRTSGSVARNSDHWTTEVVNLNIIITNCKKNRNFNCTIYIHAFYVFVVYLLRSRIATLSNIKLIIDYNTFK
jgi:hypothetical protein